MKHAIIGLFTSALAFLSTCCAHQHTPPAVGFYAQRELHTPVYCVQDGNSPCLQVSIAVAAINKAAGAEALRYEGVIPRSQAKGYTSCENVILVTAAELPDTMYGVTAPACFDSQWLKGTAIGLNMHLIHKDGADVTAIIIHELLHALGEGHADEHTTIPTIMYPSYQRGVVQLTAADIAALRAAYN